MNESFLTVCALGKNSHNEERREIKMYRCTATVSKTMKSPLPVDIEDDKDVLTKTVIKVLNVGKGTLPASLSEVDKLSPAKQWTKIARIS